MNLILKTDNKIILMAERKELEKKFYVIILNTFINLVDSMSCKILGCSSSLQEFFLLIIFLSKKILNNFTKKIKKFFF